MDASRPSPALEVPRATRFHATGVEESRLRLDPFLDAVTVGAPDGEAGFALDADMIQVGPLTVGRLAFGASVTILAPRLDCYTLTIPVTGLVRARHDGREIVAGPGTALVHGPGGPAWWRHEARADELGIKIERCALEQTLAALLGRPVDDPLDLPPSVDLRHGAAHTWLRLVHLLSSEGTAPGSLIWHPVMADQLSRSIVHGLLLSLPHRFSVELHAPARPGPPRVIRRAVDAIQDEPGRAFSVADLAAIAGVSVRSLQEGFRRHVGATPMAYLQWVRLGRAHEALRRQDPARVTVAAVAHQAGFAHLGRFATAYRARFGVSPSETLRRPG